MLLLGLFIIGAALLFFGFLYGYIVYHKPIDRTWLEVVIGVGVTLLGEIVAQAVIWNHYGYIPLWGIWVLPTGFVLTGLPQIYFQERKYHTQRKRGNDLKNKHIEEDDGPTA